MFDFLYRFARFAETLSASISTRRPRSWIVMVLLVATGISLGQKFPLYSDKNAKYPGDLSVFPSTPVGQTVTWWLDHPFKPVPIERFFPDAANERGTMAGFISHCDKLTFRAFIPLVSQLTGGGYWTLVIANHAAALITFLLIYLICRDLTKDLVLATAATWSFAAGWAGTWGFNDMVFGDMVAVCLLLAALVTNRSLLVLLFVFLASFTDERSVFSAPLLVLFRYWRLVHPFPKASGDLFSKRLWFASRPVLWGVLGYATCRLFLTYCFNLHTGTSMMGTPEILIYHLFVSFPGKIFVVYKFLWLVPILFALGLLSGRVANRRVFFQYALCMAFAAAPAILVWDVERSLCYILPGMLCAVCFLPWELEKRRSLLLGVMLGSFLWIEPYGTALRFVFI